MYPLTEMFFILLVPGALTLLCSLVLAVTEKL